MGRDLYTDVLYGARVSLRIGLFAGLIAASIGIVVGAISAFYGRWIDSSIMRFTDILLSLPYILIALAIITVVGPGERTVILVLGLLGWMAIARVLRASILQVKETEYVEAARALGAANRRIIFRHILPNTIQPVIVYTTLFIGAAVLSGGGAVVPGRRRAAPDAGLGAHGGRGPPLAGQLPAHAVRAGHRAVDPGHGGGVRRRRPARRPRPEAEVMEPLLIVDDLHTGFHTDGGTCGGRRHLVRDLPGRDVCHRGRVRLGQVGERA